MAGTQENPDEVPGKKPVPPCGHCDWTGTTAHCFNAYCTWIKCGSCNRLTDTRKLPKGGT